MQTLFAVFRMPHRYVATIIAKEGATHSETLPVTLTRNGDDTISYVSGPAQSVMFVIGAVADHGWDTLAGVVTQ